MLSFQEKFRVMLSAFGQKWKHGTLDLAAITDPRAIEELTVHVGVNVLPNEQDTLMWSKAGLWSLVERGAQMYPSLSLRDCSNLTVKATTKGFGGKKLVDVRTQLDPRLAAVIQEEINYLQMYNQTPHYRPKEMHSISGLLGTTLCVAQQVGK